MDDSWPASPRADDLSDSISSHAAEVERTLHALEAVEAFRAEAAALRAELQAARAPAARRPAPIPAPVLSAGTWRLIVEAAFLVAVAVVAWTIDLHRLEIVIVMAGAWLLVAVFEAFAWRRSEGVYPLGAIAPPSSAHVAPPSSAHVAPPLSAPASAPPVAAPEPAASGVVAAREPELVELTTVLPSEPELEPSAEPLVLADDEDGGPMVGPYAALEEQALAANDLQVALSPKRLRLPRLRRRRDKSPV